MWWHVSSCSDDNKITKSLYNHLCLINSRIYLFVLIHSAIATSSQCLLVSEVWTRTSRDNNQLRISKSKTNKTDLEPAPVQCQHQSWPQWWHWRWWRWWDVCPITYLRSVTNSLVWRVSVNTSAAPWRVSPRRGLWLTDTHLANCPPCTWTPGYISTLDRRRVEASISMAIKTRRKYFRWNHQKCLIRKRN